MDKKLIDEIIGRAVADADFRRDLKSNPEKALQDAGYSVSPTFLAAIKAASSTDLDALASEYETRFPGGQTTSSDSDDESGSGSGAMG
ncbi:Os1348 family NHLP clan protein [Vitiosangium sp. GDMCC 1.1324]|uniref:Os1348 family NHLP clan protein n=1 Tax=Vitiosangium sp. (strain GDMCC 1.1324) TaxID=2138576 RepID=UPI000D3C90D6|nr:Os1348 family NHLP clan protein [Vitiosangium sp. GDMCC 1.1324]PTL78125.1 hypothetical protein DAT35_41670 [Vitiosangium sp. GDMCC 1.1324]